MSAPSEPVALEYQLTESEFASFVGEAFARRRLYKWLWPQRDLLLALLFLTVVLIAMLAFRNRAWWGDAHTRLIISTAFGLLVLLTFTFDPLVSSLVIRRRARSGKYESYLQRIRLEVDLATLRATNMRTAETWEWQGIRDIKFSRIGGMIYVPPANAFMIPKRAFATEGDFMTFMNKVNQLPRVRAGKS